MTALSYFVKMGGTCSQELLQVTKEISDYLLANRIAVTTEYLPSSLNGNLEITKSQTIGIWISKYFFQILKVKRISQIDLFASRMNHQLPKYMPWYPDWDSCAVDFLQHSWRNLYGYVFPPFGLIGRVLVKVRKDQSLLLIITPPWQTHPWYTAVVAMSVHIPWFYLIWAHCCKVLRGKSTLFRKVTKCSWWHGRFQEILGRRGTCCHTYTKS